jgi:glycosyltransferase involved in cell wall biosynthesis
LKAPRHILFISHSYPTEEQPWQGAFVEEMVKAVARAGARCTVLAPIPVHKPGLERPVPRADEPQPSEEVMIKVLRPSYLSLSSKKIGGYNSFQGTLFFFQRAIRRVLRQLDEKPDVVYGHFLYSGGASAVRIGMEQKIPSFVGVGESSFWSVAPLGVDRAQRDFRHVTGAIAVSSVNKRKLKAELNIPEKKIRVFPNGVDLARFSPRNKRKSRAACGLPQDSFIAAFVGHFDERKGADRLTEATRRLEGVGVVCAGSGSLRPAGPQVLFADVLPHADVPSFLSAADVFVLPTRAEGCCNAVIEAMACGLPVITSEGDFMDDIVNDSVAIRVDPDDVAAIRHAIIRIRDNPGLRAAMAASALEHSKSFDINERARRVLGWMAERVDGAVV